MQQKTEPEDSVKDFIAVLAADIEFADYKIEVGCIADFGRIVVAADCIAGFGRIVVAADCIAELGRIVVAAERIAGFGRIVVAVECNSVVWRRIENKLAEPPVDSSEVLLSVKYSAHVRDRLAPVARLEKCSSRALSADRKLDLRSGRRPPEVAWNSAASAPLFLLPAVALGLIPFSTFHAL